MREKDPRNADAALLILGIACRDPKWTETDTPDEERPAAA